VTLDPAYDRPPVLKAQAQVYGADPAVWSFLTGEPTDLQAFAPQFGIYSEADAENPGEIIHSLRTAILDAEGRLVRNTSGNDWTPAELLADLTSTPAPAR
jgi:protein SCO1/2